MRTVKYFVLAALSLGIAANVIVTRADDSDKPKHTVKEIMKVAHKEGLFKKVIGGQASDDDKKELADLFADLPKNSPKKGTAESWKEKSNTLAKAAKEYAEGKADVATLKKANDCKACHTAHR
jgi:lysylphosphatidylglycerol synthetase-like protein (DUF2156 family)